MIPAAEFGKALWQLAAEAGKCDEWRGELDDLAQLMREHPEYTKLLDTPAVPMEERQKLLEEAFASVDPMLLNFMKLLCRRHAVRQLAECAEEYAKLYRAERGIAVADVVTAGPLTEDRQEKLRQKLSAITGKQVELHCTTDAAVMGGIRVCVDGKLLDGTVRARLDSLRGELQKTALFSAAD